MKQATCNDLKGSCDTIIVGDTPEEMAENSRKHIMEMAQKGDQPHIDAMDSMKMMTAESQQKWYDQFVASFDNLEDV